jgi:hypothetical protein
VIFIASTYEYTDVAGLEAFMQTDLETLDARYTNANVEAVITQAERWVNSYCKQSFTGTIPDGVVFATLEMARYLMCRQMVEDDNLEEIPYSLSTVIQLCKVPLASNIVEVSYSSSAEDYYLPDLED